MTQVCLRRFKDALSRQQLASYGDELATAQRQEASGNRLRSGSAPMRRIHCNRRILLALPKNDSRHATIVPSGRANPREPGIPNGFCVIHEWSALESRPWGKDIGLEAGA